MCEEERERAGKMEGERKSYTHTNSERNGCSKAWRIERIDTKPCFVSARKSLAFSKLCKLLKVKRWGTIIYRTLR